MSVITDEYILLYAVASALIKQQKNPAPQDRISPSVIPEKADRSQPQYLFSTSLILSTSDFPDAQE